MLGRNGPCDGSRVGDSWLRRGRTAAKLLETNLLLKMLHLSHLPLPLRLPPTRALRCHLQRRFPHKRAPRIAVMMTMTRPSLLAALIAAVLIAATVHPAAGQQSNGGLPVCPLTTTSASACYNGASSNQAYFGPSTTAPALRPVGVGMLCLAYQVPCSAILADMANAQAANVTSARCPPATNVTVYTAVPLSGCSLALNAIRGRAFVLCGTSGCNNLSSTAAAASSRPPPPVVCPNASSTTSCPIGYLGPAALLTELFGAGTAPGVATTIVPSGSVCANYQLTCVVNEVSATPVGNGAAALLPLPALDPAVASLCAAGGTVTVFGSFKVADCDDQLAGSAAAGSLNNVTVAPGPPPPPCPAATTATSCPIGVTGPAALIAQTDFMAAVPSPPQQQVVPHGAFCYSYQWTCVTSIADASGPSLSPGTAVPGSATPPPPVPPPPAPPLATQLQSPACTTGGGVATIYSFFSLAYCPTIMPTVLKYSPYSNVKACAASRHSSQPSSALMHRPQWVAIPHEPPIEFPAGP